MTDLLVLGGGSFVGAAIVDDALSRGWRVTCLTRGNAPLAAMVDTVVADRENEATMRSALAGLHPDFVVDTWAGAPRAVALSAGLLAATGARYGYVSSRSVYAELPDGANESRPTVDADPDAASRDYATDKRGGELAVERAFGADRSIFYRAGAIVGPRDNHGRLPWWLARVHRGGPTLAPGPENLALQYIDVRDLADFALSTLAAGADGAFDTVTESGQATMGSLLADAIDVTGSDAELHWADARWLIENGALPWREVPFWAPTTTPFGGVHTSDPSLAIAAGLPRRPMRETVADTWASMLSGETPFGAVAAGLGMPQEKEAALLSAWRNSPTARA